MSESKYCQAPNCVREVFNKKNKLCNAHYQQLRLGKTFTPPRGRSGRGEPCRVSGCGRLARYRELCAGHNEQWKAGAPFTAFRHRNPDGWHDNGHGYVVRKLNGETQLQHRLVMEEKIGRKLLPHENVHHLNGDRADNRPENLELWSKVQPAGQSVRDKIRWANEIRTLYGTDPDVYERLLRFKETTLTDNDWEF